MMYGLGKKSLAKKVLLSVLAVGCISGYVMQPSALAANMSSISVDNGQIETIRDITVGHEADDISLTVASVYGGNLIAHNVEFIGRIDSAQGSRIELNYGSITTKDYAIIASDTDLNVNDVDIVGGIKIDSGSSMTMNGGSITGVKMIWDDGDPHDYTRVMSGHEGTVFTANDVKLDTNLFAQCGGKIIVNNSDVNAVEGLWVEGIDSNELPLDGATAVLELNGSDKSIYKYQRWVKVRGNANLRIIGGGTLERVSSEYIEGDPHPEIRVNRGARLDIESGEGTTNILDNLTIRDSSMYVSGKLNVLNRQDYTSGMIRFSGASQGIFGKYNADESVDTILGADAFINCEALEMYNATDDKSIVTLAAGSELNVNEYISVSGNSEFVSNGVTKAGYIRVYDGANVYINNGLVGTEEHLQANDPMMLAASAYGGQLTANNVDFIGGLVCENGGSITLAGGSVTSLKLVEDDGQPADEDDWSRVQVWGDGGIITANEVDLKTSLNAYDGGHIIVKNSNVDAMEGVWSQGKDGVSGAPTIVELYGSDTTTYKYKGYFKALDEGVLKILGGGTISRTGEEYSYMKAQNGAHLGIESGKGTTNIRSTLSIEDSTMHVSGKLNILPVDEIDRGTIYIAGQSEVLFGKYGTDAGNDPVESIVNENAFITCEGLVINDVVQDVEELSYKDYIDEKNSLIPLNGTSDKKPWLAYLMVLN